MKRIIFLFVILVFVLFAGCTTTQRADDKRIDEMQSFSPEGSGFSISLPGTPNFETQTFDTNFGMVVSKVYILDKGNMVYQVSYTDYPDEVKNADPQVVLAGVRDGAVANVHGKLVSETSTTLNGYPGKEFTTVIGTQEIYTKTYLVNNRLYIVMAAGPGYWQVLDSFNLTGVISPKTTMIPPANLVPGKLTVYFFYGEECPHCHIVMPTIQNLSKKYPDVDFKILEIWHNETNMVLYRSINQNLGISSPGVPQVVVNDIALIGDLDISNKLENLILSQYKKQ